MPYEFVPRNEYRPFQQEVEAIIKKVQNLVRDSFTFQFRTVGSAGRALIMREINGNRGFDLDYNLILNNPDADHFWKPEFAKLALLKAFDEAIKGTMFDNPEDSTTSITIKVKDRAKSRIIRSCDFAVIYYPNDEEYSYFKYVRFNKKAGNYTWEVRKSSYQAEEKLDWLKENVEGYWYEIKTEYEKLKNANKDPNKHSFQLYFESINNVFNRFYNQN